ncbi:hypothetical protein [Aneurinibacillus tyrosinisolvens]|uniref:hypothetical protein n=1 Tax=Aneurinibacillus tyrosinisolvens TaxID=1443435 RepID=UPI00063F3814|nr:hypothetical protein [Aneurinibacillus tyrosinisolvens]
MDRPVRTIHISLSNLTSDEEYQLNLFKDDSKQRELGKVMDEIRNKFGSNALLRARSYTEGGILLERGRKIGGHKA